jgi:hypothetical protein
MTTPKQLTGDDGEVRELNAEDFSRFVPFSALPADLQASLSSPKIVAPDAGIAETSQPAAC